MTTADNNNRLNKRIIIKGLLVIAVLLIFAVAMVVLNKTVDGSVISKPYRPTVDSTPLYVDLADGTKISRGYIATEDMHISGIEVLLVGSGDASAESTLEVSVTDINSNETEETAVLVSDIPVGDWYQVPLDIEFEEGGSYSFEFLTQGCNLAFMQVNGFDFDISMGFDIVQNDRVTLGDIFFYSREIMILATVITVLVILFGTAKLLDAVRTVDLPGWIAGFGCEVFLIMLFIAISANIYVTSYVGGVYITSDSDGYLREAVNLVAGNGFSYDGIAGYDSWFANWPIIYPAMIAGIMVITGLNAYLSSKIVAILTIAIIEIILYLTYRKDSWIYALVLTNLGFLGMCYNTWSEIPFILFLIMFAMFLGQIVSGRSDSVWTYAGLIFAGTAAFLTRYFGIYVWAVAGLYWILLVYRELEYIKKAEIRVTDYIKNESKRLRTIISLAISAVVSGVVSVAYLLMNKIMNGNPTGVSRGTWWDDYQTLTGDLLDALIVEIFNIFSIDVPVKVMGLSYELKVWVVLAVSVAVGIFIIRYVKRLSRESVFITMALVYYGAFICIRYRSSMDTFYFRFFAPATVLLCIGLIEPALRLYKTLEDEHTAFKRLGHVAAAILALICIGSTMNSASKISEADGRVFYDTTVANWDTVYSEIPVKSVVIWSNLDYRSTWYRPDVISGELYMDDTYESLRDRYSASESIVIKKDDALVIVSEPDYDETLRTHINDAIDRSQESDKYVILN